MYPLLHLEFTIITLSDHQKLASLQITIIMGWKTQVMLQKISHGSIRHRFIAVCGILVKSAKFYYREWKMSCSANLQCISIPLIPLSKICLGIKLNSQHSTLTSLDIAMRLGKVQATLDWWTKQLMLGWYWPVTSQDVSSRYQPDTTSFIGPTWPTLLSALWCRSDEGWLWPSPNFIDVEKVGVLSGKFSLNGFRFLMCNIVRIWNLKILASQHVWTYGVFICWTQSVSPFLTMMHAELIVWSPSNPWSSYTNLQLFCVRCFISHFNLYKQLSSTGYMHTELIV